MKQCAQSLCSVPLQITPGTSRQLGTSSFAKAQSAACRHSQSEFKVLALVAEQLESERGPLTLHLAREAKELLARAGAPLQESFRRALLRAHNLQHCKRVLAFLPNVVLHCCTAVLLELLSGSKRRHRRKRRAAAGTSGSRHGWRVPRVHSLHHSMLNLVCASLALCHVLAIVLAPAHAACGEPQGGSRNGRASESLIGRSAAIC